MEKEELESKLKELFLMLDEIRRYNHMSNVIGYDQETSCPMKAMEEHSKDLAMLSSKVFAITKSKKFINLVTELHNNISLLEEYDQVLVRDLYNNYLDEKNISAKQQETFTKTLIEGYPTWLNAKQEDNYELFKDVLKNNVKVFEKMMSLSERERKSNTLEDLMERSEKGMDFALLDPFFEKIKERVIPLLKKIKTSKRKIRTDFLNRDVPVHKQIEFSHYLLKTIGYDSSRGAFGLTEHPFTTSISKNDTRVTTHIYENNFISNMYSVIHEGGHAIFSQNIPEDTYDHYIDQNRSLAMDESVSRFFENRIGRSRAFIQLIYPEFHRIFLQELKDVTEEDLYLAVNQVCPGEIRTEADELTYSLHIAIRYELEKAIFNKEVSLSALNKKWNKLYKDYLGVNVVSDKTGVLQDVHWSSGFGYFPTYALGNAYNAMYYNKMSEEFDIDQAIVNNNIQKIVDYMKENVFSCASTLTGPQWIKKVTNREFTVDDYLDYLETKFTDIYKLED